MFVKKVNDVAKEEIKAGSGTTKQVLISSEIGPNFAMRKFSIEPGGGMPLHTNSVEHEQYILNGSADVIIGDKKYVIKKDDIVFIPAGVPHSYTNKGSEPFEFLCMIPNKTDIMEIIK